MSAFNIRTVFIQIKKLSCNKSHACRLFKGIPEVRLHAWFASYLLSVLAYSLQIQQNGNKDSHVIHRGYLLRFRKSVLENR